MQQNLDDSPNSASLLLSSKKRNNNQSHSQYASFTNTSASFYSTTSSPGAAAGSFRNLHQASSFMKNTMDRWLNRGSLQDRPKTSPSIYLSRVSHLHDCLQSGRNLTVPHSATVMSSSSSSNDNNKHENKNKKNNNHDNKLHEGYLSSSDDEDDHDQENNRMNDKDNSNKNKSNFLRFAARKSQQPWFVYHNNQSKNSKKIVCCIPSLSSPSDTRAAIDVAKRTKRAQTKRLLKKKLNLDDGGGGDGSDHGNNNYNNDSSSSSDDDDGEEETHQQRQVKEILKTNKENMLEPLCELSITTVCAHAPKNENHYNNDDDDSDSEKDDDDQNTAKNHRKINIQNKSLRRDERDELPVDGATSRVRQVFISSDPVFVSPNDDVSRMINNITNNNLLVSPNTEQQQQQQQVFGNFSFTANPSASIEPPSSPQLLASPMIASNTTTQHQQKQQQQNNDSNASIFSSNSFSSPFSFSSPSNNNNIKSSSSSSSSSITVGKQLTDLKLQSKNRNRRQMFTPIVLPLFSAFDDDIFSNNNNNNNNEQEQEHDMLIPHLAVTSDENQNENQNMASTVFGQSAMDNLLAASPTMIVSGTNNNENNRGNNNNMYEHHQESQQHQQQNPITFPLIDSHTICISDLSSCKRYFAFSRVQVLTTDDVPILDNKNGTSIDHSKYEYEDETTTAQINTKTISVAGNPAFSFGFSSKRNRRLLLLASSTNKSTSSSLLMKGSEKLTELVRICANDDVSSSENNNSSSSSSSSSSSFGQCLIPLGISADDLELQQQHFTTSTTFAKTANFKTDLESKMLNDLRHAILATKEQEGSKRNNNVDEKENKNDNVDIDNTSSSFSSSSLRLPTLDDISLIEFEFTFPLANSFSPQNEFLASVWNCDATFEISSLETEKIEEEGLELRRKHEKMNMATTVSATLQQQDQNQDDDGQKADDNREDEETKKKRREAQEARTRAERKKRCRNLPKRSVIVTRRVQVLVVFDLILQPSPGNASRRPYCSIGPQVVFENDVIHSEHFLTCWKNLTRARRSVKEYDTSAVAAVNSKNNNNTNVGAYIPATEDEENDENSWFHRVLPVNVNDESELVIDRVSLSSSSSSVSASFSRTQIQFNSWNSHVVSVLSNGVELSFWQIVHKDDSSSSSSTSQKVFHLEELSSKRISLLPTTSSSSVPPTMKSTKGKDGNSEHSSSSSSKFVDLPSSLLSMVGSKTVISCHCWYDEDAVAFMTKSGILCNVSLDYFEIIEPEIEDSKETETEKENSNEEEEDCTNNKDSEKENESSTKIIVGDYNLSVGIAADLNIKNNNKQQQKTSSWIGINCCLPNQQKQHNNTTTTTSKNDLSLFAVRSDGVIVQLVRRFAIVPSTTSSRSPQQQQQQKSSTLFNFRDQFTVEQIFAPLNNEEENSSIFWPPSTTGNQIRITNMSFSRDSTGSALSDANYWKTLYVSASTNTGTRCWCALHHHYDHHQQQNTKNTTTRTRNYFNDDIDDDEDNQNSLTSDLERICPGVLISQKYWNLIHSSPQLSVNEYLNRQDDGNGRVTKWTSSSSNKISSTSKSKFEQQQLISKDFLLNSSFSMMPALLRSTSSSASNGGGVGFLHFLAYRCASANRFQDCDLVFALANISTAYTNYDSSSSSTSKMMDSTTITQVGKIPTLFGSSASSSSSSSKTQEDPQQHQDNNNTSSQSTSSTASGESRIVSFALHPTGKSLCIANPNAVRIFHATLGSGIDSTLRGRKNKSKNKNKNDEEDFVDVSFEGGVHFNKGPVLRISEVFRVEFDDTATTLVACQGKRIFILDPTSLSIHFIFDGHISAVQCFRFVYDENEKVAQEKERERNEAKRMLTGEKLNTMTSSSITSLPPKSIISADLSGNIHLWSLAPKRYQNYEYYDDPENEDDSDDFDSDDSDGEHETGGGNIINNANSDQADKKRRAREQLLRDAEKIHGQNVLMTGQSQSLNQSSNTHLQKNKSNYSATRSSAKYFLPGSNFVGIENLGENDDKSLFGGGENSHQQRKDDLAFSGGYESDLSLVPISGEALHSIHIPNFLIADCMFAQNHRSYYNNQEKNNNTADSSPSSNNNNINDENASTTTNSFLSTAPWIIVAGRFKETIPGECRKDAFALILTSIVDRKKLLQFHLKEKRKGGGRDGSPSSPRQSNKYSIDLKGEFKKRKAEKKKQREKEQEKRSPKTKDLNDDGEKDDKDEKAAGADDDNGETSSNDTSFVLSSYSDATTLTTAQQRQKQKQQQQQKQPKKTHRQRQREAVRRNHQIIIHTGVSYYSEDDDATNWNWNREDDVADLEKSFNQKQNNNNNNNSSSQQQQQHVSASAALLNRLQARRCSGRILELLRMRPKTVFVEQKESQQDIDQNHNHLINNNSASNFSTASSAMSTSANNKNTSLRIHADEDERLVDSLPYTSSLLVGRPDGKVACYEYPIRISGTRPYQVLSVFGDDDEKDDSEDNDNDHTNHLTEKRENRLPPYLRSPSSSFIRNPLEIICMKFIPESRTLAIQSRVGSLSFVRVRNLEAPLTSPSNNNVSNNKNSKTKLLMRKAKNSTSFTDDHEDHVDNDEDQQHHYQSRYREAVVVKPKLASSSMVANNDSSSSSPLQFQNLQLPSRLLQKAVPQSTSASTLLSSPSAELIANNVKTHQEQQILPTAKSWFVDAANPVVAVSKDFLFHLDNTRAKAKEGIKRVETESSNRILEMTKNYENWKQKMQQRKGAETRKLENEIKQELDTLRNVEEFHQTFAEEREVQFQNTIDGIILAQHQHEQDCVRRVEDGEAKLQVMRKEFDRRAANEEKDMKKKLKQFEQEMEDEIRKVEKKRDKKENAVVDSLRQYDAMIRQATADFNIHKEQNEKMHSQKLETLRTQKTKSNFNEHVLKQEKKALMEEMEKLRFTIHRQKEDADQLEEGLTVAGREESTLVSALRDMHRDSLTEDAQVRSLHILRNKLEGVRNDMNRTYDTLFDTIAERSFTIEDVQHRISTVERVLSITTDEAVVLSRENQLVSAHLGDQSRRVKLIEKAQAELKRVEKHALAGVLQIAGHPGIVQNPQIAHEPMKRLLAEIIVEKRRVFTNLQNRLDDREMLLTTRIGETGELSLTKEEEEEFGRLGDSLAQQEQQKQQLDPKVTPPKKQQQSNSPSSSSSSKIKMSQEIRQILEEFKQKEEIRKNKQQQQNHSPSAVFPSSDRKKDTNNKNNEETETEEEKAHRQQQERLEELESKKQQEERERERDARWKKVREQELRQQRLEGEVIRRENQEKLRSELQKQVESVKKQKDAEERRAAGIAKKRDRVVANQITGTKALMDEIDEHRRACQESGTALAKMQYQYDFLQRNPTSTLFDHEQDHGRGHKHRLLAKSKDDDNDNDDDTKQQQQQQQQQQKHLARMQAHVEPSSISFLSNQNVTPSSVIVHENERVEQDDLERRFHHLSPSVQHQRLTISQMKDAVALEKKRDSFLDDDDDHGIVQSPQKHQIYSIFNHHDQHEQQQHNQDHHTTTSSPSNIPNSSMALVGSPSKGLLRKWRQPTSTSFTSKRNKVFLTSENTLSPMTSPDKVMFANLNRNKLGQHHQQVEIERVAPVNMLAPTSQSQSPSSSSMQNNNKNQQQQQSRNFFQIGGSSGGGGALTPQPAISSNLVEEYKLAKKSVEAVRRHRAFHSLQRKVLFDRTALVPKNDDGNEDNKKVEEQQQEKQSQQSQQSSLPPRPTSSSNHNTSRTNNKKNKTKNVSRRMYHQDDDDNDDDEEIDWTGTPKSGNSRASSAK